MFLNLCVSCALLVSVVSLHTIPIKVPSRRTIGSFASVSPNDVITPNMLPSITVAVGDPPQYVSLVVDTTSGDTWIVDVNATQPNSDSSEFWSKKSSSLRVSGVPINSQVVDDNAHIGLISGKIASDVMAPDTISSNFTLTFALIDKISPIDPSLSLDLPSFSTAGVVGLGFHATKGMMPFMDKLLNTGDQTRQAFSLVLIQCMPDPGQSQLIGNVVVGGLDSRYCDANTESRHPMPNAQAWNIKMQGLLFSAQGLGGLGLVNMTFDNLVTFDTTQMLTGVPQNVYDTVVKMTGAKMDPKYKWPVVDCSVQYPNLQFKFDGKEVIATERMYIYREFSDSNTPCHLMVYPLMNGGGYLPSWSFGYLMIYEKCMLFHHGENYISFSDYNKDICN